ncbi:Putative stress-induced protein OsmC family [Flavobacterium indicum GPTSA100-9 = DSM 17447]|uniref:Putative stress-induced protein OsmC family n=1 Tax=Flavobacterium indicum (strain DSM 17447 / CIP 109464 / GPTSA100-9) TaxID=1094466 RepID=H8XQI5_FLAIG|nr:OsmC family protein [Flavobacterium indicum]CCG52479.1 Putative stress-induced protein OsmC family [Flavobacterium indicum GPTSA100-9 = DSM 17447]
MKITLKRIDEDYHFELQNERGHKVYLDNRAEFGGQDLAPSPMELLLMGVAGCSAIDIITILKKQRQVVTNYFAEVEGVRVPIEEAKPFKDIKVTIFLEGEISEEKAQKAAQLSFEKYCSVSKTFAPSVEINYQVNVIQK